MPRPYMGHIGGLALFLFVAASLAVAVPGYLRITVNDAFTHYAVPAFVKGAGPELFSVYTDEAGRLNRELAPGEYRIEVSAPGYKDLKSRATIEAGKTNFWGFMLTPLDPPEEEKLVPSRLRPGFTLIHSYAIDDRGQPVGGVRVHLEKAGTATVTDRRGYYWMSAPTPPEAAPDVPGIDTLIAEKRGYKTIVHRNIPIGGDDAGGYFLEMERGTGKREFDDTHKQMRKNVEPQAKPPYAPKKRASRSVRLAGSKPNSRRSGLRARGGPAASVTVPRTIIVGLSHA